MASTSPTASTTGSIAFLDAAAPAASTGHRSRLSTTVPSVLRRCVLSEDHCHVLDVVGRRARAHLSDTERVSKLLCRPRELVAVVDDLRGRVIEVVGVADDRDLPARG